MHNHANSFISGVVYLTPTHPDARTVFMKPPGGTDFSFKNDHAGVTTGPYNADKWISMPPEPGDVVLFPSYLLHAVPPNPGERRITLAFNAIPTAPRFLGLQDLVQRLSAVAVAERRRSERALRACAPARARLMMASGFAGLGYQIVWTQQSALWLGHESAAVLAVVAAFFGGLALGALVLSPRIDRSAQPGALVRRRARRSSALWSLALAFLLHARRRAGCSSSSARSRRRCGIGSWRSAGTFLAAAAGDGGDGRDAAGDGAGARAAARQRTLDRGALRGQHVRRGARRARHGVRARAAVRSHGARRCLRGAESRCARGVALRLFAAAPLHARPRRARRSCGAAASAAGLRRVLAAHGPARHRLRSARRARP